MRKERDRRKVKEKKEKGKRRVGRRGKKKEKERSVGVSNDFPPVQRQRSVPIQINPLGRRNA